MQHMDTLPLLILAPVLAIVAYCDLRFMRIPNVLSLIAIVVFALCALLSPPDDLWLRLAVAGGVLVLGGTAFAFRLIGGGDVKFLSAMMLSVPTSGLPIFANVFSVSLLTGIVFVLGLRRIPATQGWGWKTFGGSQKFPMGISIALAGLAFPLVAFLMRGP